MTLCAHCSTPVPRDAAFCPKCGARQASETSLPTLPQGVSSAPRAAGGERFLPGTVLEERYRITGRVGRGGMGEVYRADDLKLGQTVALKFLPEGLEADADRLQRLLGEVRTARQVTHPNVCRVYDIGETDGLHFLSMEYVDGEDLSSLLRRVGRLPEERAVRVARQICAGLAAAHERGILHRDLKPANIMLDGRGQVRITDFGLASLAHEIGAGDIATGTPAYMAPEQARGEAVTVQSDLYSLGLVLYEVYTGKRALDATTLEDLQRQREHSSISAPSALVRDLDPAAERAILHCLEADPVDRPRSALAVSAALPGGDPLAAALAAGETPSPELVAEAQRAEALAPWKAITLAALALVLFVAGTRWAGSMSYLHYLSLEDPPAVLVHEARTLLESIGYTEPAYSKPRGRGWGFTLFANEVDRARADSLADPWSGLADRPGVMAFWYRQSPDVLRPGRNTPQSFTDGLVRLDDPWPRQPGEAIVLLDLSRRQLHRLEVMPKRYTTLPGDPPEVDWSPLLEMAGLDTARLAQVRPRYRRFFDPDRSAAWMGTRADAPHETLRVEAGSFEGRPILFQVGAQRVMEALGADPEPARPPSWRNLIGDLILFPSLLLGAWLARRNLARGSADRRGAMRLASVFFVLMLVFETLKSYVLWTGGLFALWGILGTAIFDGTIAGMLYLALEPFGRRIWPAVFVSSSRLLSRPRVRLRDPLIGRSVLAGAIAGALLALLQEPVMRVITPLVSKEVPYPVIIDWDTLVSQRQAVAWTIWALISGGMGAMFFAFLLVGMRALVRRRWAAVIAVIVFWSVGSGTAFGGPVPAAIGVLLLAGLVACFLRFGLLGLLVALAVRGLWNYGVTDSWSAWYGQSAVASLVIFSAITLYGAWAAMPPGGGTRLADS